MFFGWQKNGEREGLKDEKGGRERERKRERGGREKVGVGGEKEKPGATE